MQLIQLSQSFVGQDLKDTVNARDLHSFLVIGKDFSTWIKDRIDQFEFIENQDFVVIPNFGENPKGGRPSTEYALTLDMAKELSMVERTPKGKEARQYFIECERIAKDPMAMLSNPAAMRTLLLGYSEKVLALQSENSKLTPKAQVADRIAKSEGTVGFRELARMLNINERKLRQWMISNKWCTSKPPWRALASKVIDGYMEHKITIINKGGEEKSITDSYFTPKGVAKITATFNHQQPDLDYAA